jgi:dTDP-4-dehydrorhamnose 3,5-epimerase
MAFQFSKTKLDGVILIRPEVHYDERGFFLESYTKKYFEEAGIKDEFVQDNHSFSIRNTIRGLHYQEEPYAQSKLIRCISGEILDVVVDIRMDSDTFGKYVSVTLSSENKNMLYIPRGFAHGFLVMSDYAEVIYKTNNYYSRDHERGIIWNDEDIGIDWPVKNPIISAKDKSWPSLKNIRGVRR